MKSIDDRRIIELTERNITALIAKLGDPLSARMLISPVQPNLKVQRKLRTYNHL